MHDRGFAGWQRVLRLVAAVGLVAMTVTHAGATDRISAPVAVHPDDPLRFAIGETLWFPAGYYPALGTLTDRDRIEDDYYAAYFDRLAAHGLNFTRLVFTMGQGRVDASLPYLRTGPGLAADGGPRFDLTRFDEAHFDYWRRVLAHALDRGIVVQLVIFDAWHNRKWTWGSSDAVWGMKYDFFAARNNINRVRARTFSDWTAGSGPVFEAQTMLVGKVVDALGGFPNIIWEVANEATVAGGAAADRWQRTLADFITRREAANGYPRHLVMPRDLPNHERIAHDRDGMIDNRRFGQPLLIDNDIGIDIWTPEFRRAKAWAALTSGAHINFFHFPMGDPEVLRSEDVVRGMRYVGHSRRFVRDLDVDLVGMEPCDRLVSTGWCFGRPGDELVVYLPEGGPVTVEGLPGRFRATWFDPRTGATQPANGAAGAFEAPTGEDWALHIARHG